MPRKRRIPEQAHHERWLVSYADFITLLFAFFVVMFASSVANKEKARRVSRAVEQALDGGRKISAPQNAAPAQPASRNSGELEPYLRVLEKQFAQEIGDGKLKVALEQRGLVVSLREATLFAPGKSQIENVAFPVLTKLSSVLRTLGNSVRLEGHTDSTPIHTPLFRSNWDLSTARAVAVLALLEENFGVQRNRLSAAGYADTIPADSNDTDVGRSHNRRVDLVILGADMGTKGGLPSKSSGI